MLNIVMPMAGRGKRFADAGYKVPKPLIPIHGQPMTKLVIDNLRPARAHRFIFIVLQEHIDAFGIDAHLRTWAPDCLIVPVLQVTQGAACTVLLAREYINNDDPLMIANCDQWVDFDINAYLAELDRQRADGLIMTMWADDPKWSFCRFDGDGRMTEVVEKQVISNEATVGIYNFRRGRDFVRAAEAMIRKNLRVNGEFYVAPAYNELIGDGAPIAHYNVGRENDGMWGLGIPADLEKFNHAIEQPITRLMRLAKIYGRSGVLNRLADAVGESRGTWVTTHERPRNSNQVGTLCDPIRNPTAAGIVIQGPIRTEDDFTLNTVRIYRRHFPQATVIVSTWVTEDAGHLAQIEQAGAIVLQSKMPEFRGVANINCQIASTRAGVDVCRDRGLPYILKTRGDQRFYAPNTLDFLRTLTDTFPVKAGFQQTARIVGINLDTFKFRLYGLGDHLLFGTAADMAAFWSVDHDPREIPAVPGQTWNEASLRNVVETYLVTEFLKKIGRPVHWTLQDSLAVYGDHFCVIDKDTIDLFWPKYQPHKEHRQLAYDAVKNIQELSFRDWLLFYGGRIDTAGIPPAGLDITYGGRMY